MKKYWLVFVNQFSSLATYRMELFMRWIMNSFDVVVYSILWSLVYSGDPVQIKKIILYFTLYWGVVNNIHTGRVAQWISRDINSGEINNFLIKPIYFPLVQVMKCLVVVIMRVFIPCLILIFGSIFLPDIFAPKGWFNLVLFLGFTLMGMVIWNLMLITISTLAFRGTEIKSLLTSLDLVLNLAKGAYIPAYLFSEKIKQALALTFIPYLASFPIRLYQEVVSSQEIINALSVGLVWVGVFFMSAIYLYNKGLKIYEAQGG